MTKKRGKFSQAFSAWCDKWQIALKGVVLATKTPRFWAVFIVAFILFGTLLNLLAGGTAAFKLIGTLGFPEGLKVICDAFLSLFGVGRNFVDWILIFFLSLMQACLIALIVLVWKKRKDSSESIERAGIVAGLAVLGSGCPTCGTTLLAPVVAAIFGSGGLAIAGTISWIMNLAAIVLALFALRKLGYEAYMLIMEDNLKEKEKNEKTRN